MKNYLSVPALLMALWIGATSAIPARACTDFLLTTTDGTKIVGRSMEWGLDLKSQLCLHARDESFSSTTPTGAQSISWKSKYGYVAADANDKPLAIDGINEQGLSLGSLWMPGSIYQEVGDKPQSALSVLDLGHYVLGTCKNVDEAKTLLKSVRVWSPQLAEWGGTPTMHLALHDAQGHSAVVEFVNGEQKVYDNLVHVLTNAPTFDWHCTNLRNYIHVSADNAAPMEIRGTVLAPPGQGGGFLGIPGDWTPPSRFVRTSAMLAFAKKTDNAAQGVNLALHVLNAVDIPLGDTRPKNGDIEHSDYTQWILIKDLTNRVIYFRSYDNSTLRALDLKKLNFAPGTKSQRLTAIAGGSASVDITSQIHQ